MSGGTGPTLAEATGDDIAALGRIVGEGGTLDAASEAAAPYLVEPRDRYHGHAAVILKPAKTEEVAEVVRYCAAHRLGLVARSGGTGLVGGQIATGAPAPVLLSLERMNRVRAVLPEDAAIVAEAGVILADLQEAARSAGRLFPLSMASEGSCRLGGVLGTNAGGVAVLHYGTTRELCLGVEAVLPDGSVFSRLSPLRKDNTGYDLRHLLIGSEGTLGIITAAVMKLFPAPGEVVTAMLALPSPAAAVELLQRLRERLGDTVTAFELMARNGMDWVAGFYPDRKDPLAGRPEWRVLVELSSPSGMGLAERAEAAFADAIETGLAEDGAIAQSGAQAQAMWWMRETIPEANRRIGAVSSHDLAVPISRIPAFIEGASQAVAGVDPALRINCFGHVGDGNLHFNVFPPEGRSRSDYDPIRGIVRRAVHDTVAAEGGTISAEHGIGRAKAAELLRYGDPAKLAAMRAIKRALDPHGIMNPGAVIDAG